MRITIHVVSTKMNSSFKLIASLLLRIYVLRIILDE